MVNDRNAQIFGVVTETGLTVGYFTLLVFRIVGMLFFFLM